MNINNEVCKAESPKATLLPYKEVDTLERLSRPTVEIPLDEYYNLVRDQDKLRLLLAAIQHYQFISDIDYVKKIFL